MYSIFQTLDARSQFSSYNVIFILFLTCLGLHDKRIDHYILEDQLRLDEVSLQV